MGPCIAVPVRITCIATRLIEDRRCTTLCGIDRFVVSGCKFVTALEGDMYGFLYIGHHKAEAKRDHF